MNPDCQKVIQILNRLGDKWTIMVIAMLAEQPRRFNELKRLIGGISQQMLTRTLKTLEWDGMVTRHVHPTVPPQVEYSLTPLGRSLAIPLMELSTWVIEHLDAIEANRARSKTKQAADVGGGDVPTRHGARPQRQ